MTRALPAIVVAALAALPGPQDPARPQQPTFRAATSVVLIDVSVKNGGRPVTGLGPTDFALTDNGIRQTVDTVDTAVVPIDLTLVLDVSGSSLGTLDDKPDPAAIARRVNGEVASVAALLRPDDRIRVLTFDTYSRQIIPFASASAVPKTDRVAGGSAKASLSDTLLMALMHTVEPSRRHIVLARTKGRDTMSAEGFEAVTAVARRSDSMVHIVTMEDAFDSEIERRGFQCNPGTDAAIGAGLGLCEAIKQFWQPFARALFKGGLAHPLTPSGESLATAAELTGGGMHRTEGLSTPSILGTFKQAFDEFRQGYMLRYTPSGVPSSGWHDVNVSLSGFPGYTLRWRRGYAFDQADNSAATDSGQSTAGVSSAAPAELRSIITATDAADYGAVLTRARDAPDKVKLLRDFVANGNPWPPAPRREAVLAIDLATAAVFSHRDDARSEARNMLERFQRLVRNSLAPDAFEHDWTEAELAVAVGAISPPFAETLVARALVRFPTEPRFLLARAIVADQRWPIGFASPPTPGPIAAEKPAPGEIANVITRYESAAAFDDTAVEAGARLAWFLHRLGRDSEALERIDRVHQPASDTDVEYLRRLIRGHILLSLRRPDAAMAEFRAATTTLPGAQSGDVAVMEALVMAGDRAGAEAIAERVQAQTAPPFDPWSMYWQGDLRRLPDLMSRLREASR